MPLRSGGDGKCWMSLSYRIDIHPHAAAHPTQAAWRTVWISTWIAEAKQKASLLIKSPHRGISHALRMLDLPGGRSVPAGYGPEECPYGAFQLTRNDGGFGLQESRVIVVTRGHEPKT